MGMSLSKFQELVMDKEAYYAVIHGATKSQTRLSNWMNWLIFGTLHMSRKAAKGQNNQVVGIENT